MIASSSKPGRRSLALGLLVPLCILGREVELRAQTDPPTPKLAVGAGAIGGLLVGASDDFLDGGYGIEAGAAYRVVGANVWGRAELGYLDLSDASDPFNAISADNSLLSLFVGPEFTISIWRLEPFARGFIGFAANLFQSRGVGIPERKGTDWNFAWGAGIGLRALLHAGNAPFSLELSGRLVDAGNVDFARPGSPGGSEPSEVTSDIRVLELSVGLRLGIPGT